MSPVPRPTPPARKAALLAGLSLAALACSTGSPAGRHAAATAAPAPPPVAETAAAPSTAAVAAPAPRGCASPCASIERCDEATGACAPNCPAGEVYIPATGPAGFTMGKGLMSGAEGGNQGKGHYADTDKPHRVVLTKPFCMDATEVTVAAYRECVDAGRCDPPKFYEIRANYPRKPDHPVNEVGWDKARKYCEAQGKRLPTEAQWEWAATGADGRKWPWGDEQPTCELADFTIGNLVSPGGNSGCHGGGTSPVKAHPKGNKVWPAGELYDMAGNVWEWCEDTYAPYAEGDAVDPLVSDPKKIVHVVRGGGWNRSVRGIQTAFRGAAIHTYEVPALGFRCVRNPADPPAGG
jgi:formylglycine-generating enzyme required for sulfatase activity